MARLIDADALMGPLKLQMQSYRRIGETERAEAYANCLWEIAEAPAIDAVPVVNGRWLEKQPTCASAHKSRMSVCSKCGATGRKSWHYCPYCGAKMDEDAPTCGPDYCEIGGGDNES